MLLVAPPSLDWLAEHPEVEGLSRGRVDPAALALAARSTRLVASDNDEYCPNGAPETFPELARDFDGLPGAGHINVDAGYGDWPSVLSWCRDPATRLTPRVAA